MKKMTGLLLVLCMLMTLAACASGDGTVTPTDDADVPSSTVAVDETSTGSAGFDVSKYDGVDFEIMWQESDSTQIDIVENYAMAAVAEAFPNVNITWTGNVDVDYTTLAQTDSLADVWFGSASLEMIQSGVLLDLTSYLTADTYLADNFSNPDFFYFKDHIWALGTGVDNFYTGTLYYNQDAFDTLGMSIPTTWDELDAACATLLDAGYTIPLNIEAWMIGPLMLPNLIIAVDPAAYADILAGGDLNSDGMTEAATRFAAMRDAGYFGTGVSVKNTSVSEFVEGKSAILYTPSWNNGSIAAAEFNITVGWWPTANSNYETGENYENWGSPLSGWNAKADTEYPELAVEIIKCIVKAEAARHLNAGIATNYIQDSAPTPVNDLEAQRLVLFNEVGTWYKNFWQNTMDSTCTTEINSQISTLCSDDHYPVADFIAAIQTAWDANTFFD